MAALAQAQAAADTRNKSEITAGLNGTTRYFLETNTTAPMAIGPNESTSIDDFPAAGGSFNVVKTIPADPTTVIDFPGKGGVITYSPVVKSALTAKPVHGHQTARDSSSGLTLGNVLVGSLALGTVINNANAKQFGASAQTFGGAAATAASIDYDPYTVTGPSPGYFPLNYVDGNDVQQDVYLIDGSLTAPTDGDFAAIEFLVIDSRYEPDPANLGDPANYL
jgi:hypothetical protein